MDQPKSLATSKRPLILLFSSFVLAAAFTIIVKFVDVQPIGPEGSKVGLAGLNSIVFLNIGESPFWRQLTDFLGIALGVVVVAYVIFAIIRLVRTKSLKKLNRELLMLGFFYLVLAIIYLVFEKLLIVNFRPILIDGALEASYPSSHTLFALAICGSAIMVNSRLFSGLASKVLNIVLCILAPLIVIGRLLSGVHWFTDIAGGVLFAAVLLASFSFALSLHSPKAPKV